LYGKQNIRLTAVIQDFLGKPAPEKYKTFPDFDEARDDGVAVASAGPFTDRY